MSNPNPCWAIAGLTAALGLGACSGQLAPDGIPAGPAPSGLGQGTFNDGTGTIVGADGGPASTAKADVGRVGIHRLNNLEYDHTVRDLLGVAEGPGRTFIADEQAGGFDNNAAALGMTAARYEQYFHAADALVEEVWADTSLRERILSCTPQTAADETACARQALEAFGLRAYRRPVEADELDRLVAVVGAVQSLGEPFDRGVAQAVKAVLASPAFLYRVELDDDPNSSEEHPLSAYELASRLSYLLWSTMPDAELFDRAADGSLLEDATLLAEVDRMLGDPRAQRFVESFAGQWLGLRALASHQVDPSVFPAWSEGLRAAMVQEALSYFEEFLYGSRGMDSFFTADVNFVDDELAQLYGFSDGPFDADQALEVADDGRRGFLGLASFLTFSSFSYRTAPTLRGKWVLENLLCTEIPPPPGSVPQLDDQGGNAEALASQNVRIRLAAHREDPSCAGCHSTLDPIGLGLERFDGIGQERERYANGDAIDTTGELPGGQLFDGLEELSSVLGTDPRLTECTSEKLLTYALGREVEAGDQPTLEEIRHAWQSSGYGLRSLIEQIVLSKAFRMRRGEEEP